MVMVTSKTPGRLAGRGRATSPRPSRRPARYEQDAAAGALRGRHGGPDPTFQMKGDAETAADRVQPVLDAVQKDGPSTAARASRSTSSAQASAEKWLGEMLADDFKKAEFTAVPLALGILLVAFGALVAALLPVASRVTACIAAFGLLALASHQLHIFDTTTP